MSDIFDNMVDGLVADDLENVETEVDFEADWSQFKDLSLSASDWTVETLYGQIQKDNVDLAPDFQRREVWDVRKKSAFVESLMLGIPVPQIVLAQKRGVRGRYTVLDGKQRLLSIRGFYAGDYALSGLSVLKEMNGLHYEKLDDGWRDSLDNSTIRAVRISGWRSDSVLFTIFHRLNTGSMPLNPQELRCALSPGPFTHYAADFTNRSFELARLFSQKDMPDFRMRDVELLTRYSGLMLYPELFGGNLKRFLDETTIRLNENEGTATYCSLAQNAVASIKTFGEVYDEIERIREVHIPLFSLLQEDKVPRFNRAVFDALCYSARNEEVRIAIHEKREDVAVGLLELFKDARFIEACSLSTKTRQSLQRRVDLWSKALHRSIGMPVKSLELDAEGAIHEYEVL